MGEDILIPLEATWEKTVPASVLVKRLNALIATYGNLDVRIALRKDYTEILLFGEDIEVLE